MNIRILICLLATLLMVGCTSSSQWWESSAKLEFPVDYAAVAKSWETITDQKAAFPQAPSEYALFHVDYGGYGLIASNLYPVKENPGKVLELSLSWYKGDSVSFNVMPLVLRDGGSFIAADGVHVLGPDLEYGIGEGEHVWKVEGSGLKAGL